MVILWKKSADLFNVFFLQTKVFQNFIPQLLSCKFLEHLSGAAYWNLNFKWTFTRVKTNKNTFQPGGDLYEFYTRPRIYDTLPKITTWLVVEPTQLKNIGKSKWESSPRFGVKIPKILEKPPPSDSSPLNIGLLPPRGNLIFQPSIFAVAKVLVSGMVPLMFVIVIKQVQSFFQWQWQCCLSSSPKDPNGITTSWWLINTTTRGTSRPVSYALIENFHQVLTKYVVCPHNYTPAKFIQNKTKT